MSSADQDAIKKEAIIFRQKGERQITRFQALVNDAAQELCLKSPALIAKKGVLLNMAQEKVRNSGYQFKKGKSRSKKAASQAPLPKRTKITPDLRAQRISYLQEDIKDINDQLSFKQKRCDIAASVENYKLCDMLKEEMISLKVQRRERESELLQYRKKEKKSQWHRSKISTSSSESESVVLSSQDTAKDAAEDSDYLVTPSPPSTVIVSSDAEDPIDDSSHRTDDQCSSTFHMPSNANESLANENNVANFRLGLSVVSQN